MFSFTKFKLLRLLRVREARVLALNAIVVCGGNCSLDMLLSIHFIIVVIFMQVGPLRLYELLRRPAMYSVS